MLPAKGLWTRGCKANLASWSWRLARCLVLGSPGSIRRLRGHTAELCDAWKHDGADQALVAKEQINRGEVPEALDILCVAAEWHTWYHLPAQPDHGKVPADKPSEPEASRQALQHHDGLHTVESDKGPASCVGRLLLAQRKPLIQLHATRTVKGICGSEGAALHLKASNAFASFCNSTRAEKGCYRVSALVL